MPKAIVDAPPTSLFTLLDTTLPPLERLTTELDFVSNHLLQSTKVGSMAFYTIAPNPPIFIDPETGTSLSIGELLEAVMSFDSSIVDTGGLCFLEETFLSGYLHGAC
ncbi:MAG: hypothetical protein GWQ05_20290 [Verrucomicrobiaceae bacterium]|nr:hypothetical protein [Verrucomicrobiaceae bacterium]NCF93272.1 hypothetical protein [Verrucomicrobiaceae bacterium]